MKFLLFVSMLLLPVIAIADEASINCQVSKELRIQELMGEVWYPLAVEPALPENYIALTRSGKKNLYEWIYWGPKDVLEEYFKNENSLNQAIFRVKLSENVRQTGPDAFEGKPVREFKKEFEKETNYQYTIQEYQWGQYPVVATEIPKNKIGKTFPIYLAWIGLNAPEGWTLLIEFLYPSQNKKIYPTKEQQLIFDTLLKNTKPLGQLETILLYGQDLQEDYTLVALPGMRVKVTAEKQLKDGSIQVIMHHLTPNATFEYQDMKDGLIGTEWMWGEPCVKIRGVFTVEGENGKTVCPFITTTLIKTVDSFSVDPEEVKGKKDVFIYRNDLKLQKIDDKQSPNNPQIFDSKSCA